MAHFSFGQHGAATLGNSGARADSNPDGLTAACESGPGWYDSSWDLQRGLIVREGLPRDASLHEWLQHELCGAAAQPALSLV
ncbi:MAG TPA: hypothetical protein VGE16_17600 [Albitalea sp.]